MALLIFLEQYKAAGLLIAIFILIGLFYGIFIKKNITHSVAWMMGFLPFVVLLRDFIISYSGFTMILILIFISFFIISKKTIIKVVSDKYNLFFIILFGLYILFGIITTHNFIYFIKYIEYLIGFILISTLFLNKNLSKIGFTNFIIGLIFYWISLFPLISQRFQVETIYGFHISSDPSASAGFVLMGLIILLFDKGNLINLQNNEKIRYFLVLLLLGFLILSTSRTNMAIFLILLSIFSITKIKSFFKMLIFTIPLLYGSYFLLDEEKQNRIEIMYYDKLFSDERSMNQLTTGRADQWIISVHHFVNTTMDQQILGSGIANRNFYRDALVKYGAELELESQGRAFVLHSLYLIILVEMGIFAFLFFLFIMGVKFYQNFKLLLKDNLVPFYFTIAYLITIASNQGIGIIGAMFISFIFYYKILLKEKN